MIKPMALPELLVDQMTVSPAAILALSGPDVPQYSMLLMFRWSDAHAAEIMSNALTVNVSGTSARTLQYTLSSPRRLTPVIHASPVPVSAQYSLPLVMFHQEDIVTELSARNSRELQRSVRKRAQCGGLVLVLVVVQKHPSSFAVHTHDRPLPSEDSVRACPAFPPSRPHPNPNKKSSILIPSHVHSTLHTPHSGYSHTESLRTQSPPMAPQR